MKNKLIITLICVLLLSALCCGAAMADGIDWEMNSAGNLTVKGTGEMTDAPWQDFADQIKTVTISDGITSICDNAFMGCTSLTEIAIPDSVTAIGRAAFVDCTSLKEIKLPAGLTTIGENSFVNSGLESIALPNSLTVIERNLFTDCHGLNTVTLPDSLTEIGGRAFQNCTAIAEIIIPDTVKLIDYEAFDGCQSLSKANLGSGVERIGDSAFRYCNSLNEITLPNSLTVLGSGVFTGCDRLAQVNYSGTENEWKQIEIDESAFGYNDDDIDFSFVSDSTTDGSIVTGTAFGAGNPILIIIFAFVAVVCAAVVMSRKRRK